jgi:hypothetical protein
MKIITGFLIIFLCGCCTLKKTQTEIITETKIKFDTVIIIKRDTITLIKSVTLFDTVTLQNSTALARSYYSVKQQRIILELTGKSFTVPVNVYKHTLIKSNIKEKKRESIIDKIPIRYYLVFVFLCLIVIAYFKIKYQK